MESASAADAVDAGGRQDTLDMLVSQYNLSQQEVDLAKELQLRIAADDSLLPIPLKRSLQFLAARKWNLDRAVKTVRKFQEIDTDLQIEGTTWATLRDELRTGRKMTSSLVRCYIVFCITHCILFQKLFDIKYCTIFIKTADAIFCVEPCGFRRRLAERRPACVCATFKY